MNSATLTQADVLAQIDVDALVRAGFGLYEEGYQPLPDHVEYVETLNILADLAEEAGDTFLAAAWRRIRDEDIWPEYACFAWWLWDGANHHPGVPQSALVPPQLYKQLSDANRGRSTNGCFWGGSPSVLLLNLARSMAAFDRKIARILNDH